MREGLTPVGADDDRAALGEAVRQLLERECTADVVRSAWPGGDAARVAVVWRQLAGLGALGILVPAENADGLGLDETYLVAVLEETGRAGLPAPMVEVAAVGAALLARSPDHADLLAAVLRGEAVLSFTQDADAPVPYGQTADAILVSDGQTLRLVRPGHRTGVATLDGARRLATMDLSGGELVPTDTADLELASLRGTLATAAELIGLSRRMLDLTVAYVKQRHQFGAAIGSFQAVKHQLADALLAVEFAAPLVAVAAASLAAGADTAVRDVSMAKAVSSDTATLVAKRTLQCHGAMAYTTEYDHHLFAKRAWAQAAAWGSARWHRRVVAAQLGLGPVPGRTDSTDAAGPMLEGN
jgi:alkylation response protein AidB-like acyl-CoA dehydrogenase